MISWLGRYGIAAKQSASCTIVHVENSKWQRRANIERFDWQDPHPSAQLQGSPSFSFYICGWAEAGVCPNSDKILGSGLFVMQLGTALGQQLPGVVCLGLTPLPRKQGHSGADPSRLLYSIPNKLPWLCGIRQRTLAPLQLWRLEWRSLNWHGGTVWKTRPSFLPLPSWLLASSFILRPAAMGHLVSMVMSTALVRPPLASHVMGQLHLGPTQIT